MDTGQGRPPFSAAFFGASAGHVPPLSFHTHTKREKWPDRVLKIGRGAAAPPFLVMDVIAAANVRQAALPAGAPRVIRMEVGQPGTGAPAGAVAAAQAALRSGDPLG